MTVLASADDEVTVNVLELICQSCYEHITLHFDSSLTTWARVLAAVDEVVATIP